VESPQNVLTYASPRVTELPRRWWMPAAFLLSAFCVWNSHGLTPTFYPTPLDKAMLAIVFAGAVVMARTSSLPELWFCVYGELATTLFVLANFNDNNFRANTPPDPWDLLLPWCVMIFVSAMACRTIVWLVRLRRWKREENAAT